MRAGLSGNRGSATSFFTFSGLPAVASGLWRRGFGGGFPDNNKPTKKEGGSNGMSRRGGEFRDGIFFRSWYRKKGDESKLRMCITNAIASGDIESLRSFLEAGAVKLNGYIPGSEITMLGHAICEGSSYGGIYDKEYERSIDYLLSLEGIDVNRNFTVRSGRGFSFPEGCDFSSSHVFLGMEEGVDSLKEPFVIKYVTTPLSLAVENSDHKIVKKLLMKRRIDVNKVADRVVGVRIPVYNPCGRNCCKYWLDFGDGLFGTAMLKVPFTPLQNSVFCGYPDIIKLLVKHGADLEKRVSDRKIEHFSLHNETPLGIAIASQRSEIREKIPGFMLMTEGDDDRAILDLLNPRRKRYSSEDEKKKKK